MEQKQLFITGFFRSGTSLLYLCLNQHPKIKLMFEADFLSSPLIDCSSFFNSNLYDRLELYNSVFHRHGLSIPPDQKNTASRWKFAGKIYQQYAGDDPDIEYIGEKSPSYYRILPDLARNGENSSIIVIWRRPDAIISSLRKAAKTDRFFRDKTLEKRALVGMDRMQSDIQLLRDKNYRIHDLAFEDLLQDPVNALHAICGFLGIEYDAAMLDLSSADCSMLPVGEHFSIVSQKKIDIARGQTQSDLNLPVGAYLKKWKLQYSESFATRRYFHGLEHIAPVTPARCLADQIGGDISSFYHEFLIPTAFGILPFRSLSCYRDYICEKGKLDFRSKNYSNATSGPVTVSIITPSFRQVDYLKMCAASVADQVGNFQTEHLIHDGGTGRAFDDWAQSQYGAVCVSEPDDGMYDAINRGFREAQGSIIAWLNCDEQYLPGTLEQVTKYFEVHPQTDILFGDVILVDEMMTPLAYRRAVMPSLGHIRYSHLSTFSAATFVRKRVLEEGHFLQTCWKTIADAVWIEELLAAGYRAAILDKPLAVFCMLGTNLGQSPLLFEERHMWEQARGSTNAWKKRAYIIQYRLKRLRMGAYWIRHGKIKVYVPGQIGRLEKTRWISGQWDVARDRAEVLKAERDGALSVLDMRSRRTPWSLLHAFFTISLSLYVDGIVGGDAVKAPSILLLSLLFLSFRSKVRDIVSIAAIYSLVAFYCLSEQPFDRIIVRMITFGLGALLAIFWSSALRNLEEWVRTTIALIRKIPVPMILTNPHGKVLLVNTSVYAHLPKDHENLLERQIITLTFMGHVRGWEPSKIADWASYPPEGILGLSFDVHSQVPLAEAKVFRVGRGEFQFYAFILKVP